MRCWRLFWCLLVPMCVMGNKPPKIILDPGDVIRRVLDAELLHACLDDNVVSAAAALMAGADPNCSLMISDRSVLDAADCLEVQCGRCYFNFDEVTCISGPCER